MKKSKKERARRLNVTNNIKKYSEGSANPQKNTYQLLQDKLIDDVDNSSWYGFEMLYFVQTQKRGPVSLVSAKKSEKMLVLIRKKDSIATTHLLHVVCKDSTVEVKSSWDLKLLRALDLGEDDNEFVLSFDSADYSWNVVSQADRDECVWILAQYCKNVCGYDVTLGYSIDLDLIGYATKTNGTLTRFPLLQSLNTTAQIAGDVFAEEEGEAEALLEELRWTSEAPGELLATLGKQSDSLNMEIIDFLLQWEDEDGKAAAGSQSNRLRDTYEVLNALTRVDAELDAVDSWIGDQISQLSETQAKLTLIESESGTLETSYQNLSTVQDILETLVKGLSLSPSEENVLSKPANTLENILQSSSLKNVSKQLNPLLEAAAKLQCAISLKGGALVGLNPLLLKQLLSLSAVSTQRSKLVDLSEVFCKNLGDCLPSFFTSLLQHKYLNDPSKGRMLSLRSFDLLGAVLAAGVALPGTTLRPDMFKRSSAAGAGAGSDMGMDKESSSTAASSGDVTVVPAGILVCVCGDVADRSNECLDVQKLFHESFSPFIPLLNRLIDLDRSYASPVCVFYNSQLTAEHLYTPLFRALFKQIQGVVQSSKSSTSLSSISSFRVGARFESTIRLVPSSSSALTAALSKSGKKAAGSSSSTGLSPWIALSLILLIVSPIIQNEETFFLNVFPMESAEMGITCALNSIGADNESVFTLAKTSSASAGSAAGGGSSGGGSGGGGGGGGSKLAKPFSSSTASSVPAPNAVIYQRVSSKSSKSEAEQALDMTFSSLRPEAILAAAAGSSGAVIDVAVSGGSGGSSSSSSAGGGSMTSSSGATGSSTVLDIDGGECLAMLMVLQQFMIDHLGVPVDGFTTVAPAVVSEESSSPDVDTLQSRGDDQQPLTTAATVVPPALGYLTCVLVGVREMLLRSLANFLTDQLAWLMAQKSDPKKTGPATAITKYPSLVSQFSQICGPQRLASVEKILTVLGAAVIDWIRNLASQNDKYSDIVKMHNFGFLSRALQSLGVECLKRVSDTCEQERLAAETGYAVWMITYSFPGLAALSKRMEGVGGKVRQEELSLYVRRKDVMTVVTELEPSRLEESISSMRKRLDKHCSSGDEEGNKLSKAMWEKICSNVVGIVQQLQLVSMASYQIVLETGPEQVRTICSKYG